MNTNITFNDIGGYQYQKNEAEEIVNFYKDYDLFTKNGAKLPTGILFYGRPGTGKTMFANVIANESNAKLFTLTGENLLNDNGFSLSIKKIFKEAKNNAPSIVLIDEIDQLISCSEFNFDRASDKQRETLRTLLTEIDDLKESGVLVIATANTAIEEMPATLIRNGRIEKHIYVSTPDFADRVEILNIYLKQNEKFKLIKADELAKITQDFVGASLASLVNEVLIKVLSEKREFANYSDFYEPIQAIISKGIKQKPRKNIDHVIYHEIGHLIVDYKLNNQIGFINAETFGGSNGRFYKSGKDIPELLNCHDIERQAAVLLGGLAATEIFMHKKFAGSISDLHAVADLFSYMLKNGLGDFKLTAETLSQGNILPARNPMSIKYQDALAEFIETSYTRAKQVLVENKKLVGELYKALKEKKSLSSDEVSNIIKNNK